ncbi:uncharacterized protein DUF4350 [Frondihabitans sp. PhB188]|uniref:DUF4350 domain-containing protein n=1 Tax=Frondihabitans sp. PhB188 TaxID=2485200 RepID=UPI000F496BF6|nr:DUF4350 domain-containing protein [Frondihabitans sp. PhB188]ROQ36614.1 uncharacterized protein DUF4350 [Frondihabitans sp. PhB188]
MTDTATRPRRTEAPGPRVPVVVRTRILLGLGAAVVVAVLALLVVGGLAGTTGSALDAASTQPSGAKALVSVLRGQGIDVTVTTTLSSTAAAAADDPAETTIFAHDSNGYLDADQWRRLAGASSHLVVAAPAQTALDAVAPGVTASTKELTGTLAPSCDLPALAQSSRVTGDGSRYTVAAGSDADRCLPATSGGGYGLVQQPFEGSTVTVVGTTSALSNEKVADLDDSAFALALLGDSPTLVWYLPSVDDLPKGTGTLASLTPGWVTPSIALIFAAGIAGAFWRGRRLGPLVVENLPVVVRSTETTEGRARLYQRGASRVHALDQIRVGALSRLALAVGLGRGADVDQVVRRVAQFLRVDPKQVRHVLVDAVPGDDAHLMALSDSLRDLEAAVARAVRPGARP